MGIGLIIVGFIHGINSSVKITDLNWGTVLWLISIILGLNYMLRKEIKDRSLWIKIHRGLTIVFIGVLVIHVFAVGGIKIHKIVNQYFDQPLKEDEIIYDITINEEQKGQNETELNELIEYNNSLDGVTLKDGEYSGVADAFGKDLTVLVSIQDNLITSIKIVSHNERQPQIYQKALDQIPNKIIEEQSLSVDTVSGATFTSIGIMNAVNDALQNALISGKLPQMQTLPSNEFGHK